MRKRLCLVRDIGNNNFEIYGARGKYITLLHCDSKYLLQAVNYWGYNAFKMVVYKGGKLTEVKQ